jgi:hypothetical protein
MWPAPHACCPAGQRPGPADPTPHASRFPPPIAPGKLDVVSPRLALVLALAACGPQAGDTGDATTAATTTTASTTTAAPTTGTPTTGPFGLSPDEQLCVDFCKHRQDTGCPYFSESCYSDCVVAIDALATDPCAQEKRASIACELDFSLADACEAVECADVYLQEDVCTGYCWHLGGYPSSGSSTDECHWAFDGCYGHDLEMQCDLGDAPECTCNVDGASIGTCTLAVPLKALDCAGEDFHIFSGCCTPLFLEVLE